MIKKQTLVDFLTETKTKPAAAVQAAIDKLDDSFTMLQLGEALLEADGNKKSDGAMLAFTFAQYLQDNKTSLDVKNATTVKPAKVTADPAPSERRTVSPGTNWKPPTSGTCQSQAIGRW